MFPDLAGKPIKIGDTYTTMDTIDIDEGQTNLQMLFESENTLSGYETVNGLECAKITAKVKGSLKGTGNQGGADLDFEGDIEADETWFFAYKKGLFVQTSSDSFTEATIAVSGPQEMTLPMTMEMKMETKLMK